MGLRRFHCAGRRLPAGRGAQGGRAGDGAAEAKESPGAERRERSCLRHRCHLRWDRGCSGVGAAPFPRSGKRKRKRRLCARARVRVRWRTLRVRADQSANRCAIIDSRAFEYGFPSLLRLPRLPLPLLMSLKNI